LPRNRQRSVDTYLFGEPWIVPIPGTTKLERLEENLSSVDLEFTPEEWRDFNHAVSKIEL
jgi:aryl-alcohol dehydrogenase-like predicted oxidoreductase